MIHKAEVRLLPAGSAAGRLIPRTENGEDKRGLDYATR
ncbi:hypothetical protein SRB521_00311 [Intestinimonas butyriciproducens]|nr:hypothetical protein SRB521_00311 [Intestinimonas butyriciproducens]